MSYLSSEPAVGNFMASGIHQHEKNKAKLKQNPDVKTSYVWWFASDDSYTDETPDDSYTDETDCSGRLLVSKIYIYIDDYSQWAKFTDA